MIKAKEEIAGIARSAQIAEQALLASLKDFRPGDTEQDLGNSFRRHAAQHGSAWRLPTNVRHFVIPSTSLFLSNVEV